MVIKEKIIMKMKDDEQLEKLFEKMDRETARMVNNQGCPTKRTPIKKATAKTVKKVTTKKK
jgi:hypothetical protein